MYRYWERDFKLIVLALLMLALLLLYFHQPVKKASPMLLQAVKPYIGRVPYQWGGTSPSRGMDCSAFTRFIMRKFSIILPRTAREQSRAGKYIRPSTIRPGDLIFFDASKTRPGIDHVGIYLGRGYFVHSHKAGGVTIHQLRSYDYPVIFGRRVLS